MNKQKIRWGLVSAGRIAHTFAHDMSFVENSTIHAVAARSLENAESFANQYAIPVAYQGYSALFADPNIDAVYISTPHTLHYEHTKQALMAGKHVMCEKPFVVTPEQCAELCNLAKANNLFLMEAMWTWFLPAIRQAQTWIAEGHIGELKQLKADFGYPIAYDPTKREWNRDLAGGCTFEMGIYPIAFNRLFNSKTPERWHIIGKRAENGADKTMQASIDYGDSLSVIGSSFECKLRNWAYIIGTDGYIAIPDFWRADKAHLYKLDECLTTFEDERKGSGFEFQIQHAVECIRTDRTESDVVSHSDSQAFQQDIAQFLNAF